MKRLTYRKKVFLDRRSRLRPAPHSGRREIISSYTVPISNKLHLVDAPERIRAFENINRESLFKFMDRIEQVLQMGGRVKIDFAKTVEMHPCGTLVFLANLSLWQAAYPGRISCTYPEDDAVEQLLQHFDVLPGLGLAPRKKITHERVIFWRYFSGTDATASIYKELTKAVRDGIEHPQRELFADCLNEAVSNTVNHAYKFEIEGLPPKEQRKWWILSYLKDESVFVAIYDLGVTIPGSLRKKPEWADFLKLRNYKDDRLIETAVVSNRTSTKLPERGKGFPEMLEFSRNLSAGALSIVSGLGAYSYNARESQQYRYKFGVPLPGTLVLWEIPFRQERSDG